MYKKIVAGGKLLYIIFLPTYGNYEIYNLISYRESIISGIRKYLFETKHKFHNHVHYLTKLTAQIKIVQFLSPVESCGNYYQLY